MWLSSSKVVLLLIGFSGLATAQYGGTVTIAPPRPPCVPTSPYRTMDGSCNNLQNFELGATFTQYSRLLPPDYSDNAFLPRRATSRVDLPSARNLSLNLFSDGTTPDTSLTLLSMQFAQFVAHDMAQGMGAGFPTPQCCANGQRSTVPDSRCFPISVAAPDPMALMAGIQCLNMERTGILPTTSTPQGQQVNTATSFLDLSLVYGTSQQDSDLLRAFSIGRLMTEFRNGTEFPPRTAMNCRVQGNCYKFGDSRANQSPHMAILHMAFVREHNRIANNLRLLNPTWNDMTVFQEARRVNIGQYQRIVYYEWLPQILGSAQMTLKGLIYAPTTSYITDYNPTVNPSTINEHSAVAMRIFHTEIQGTLAMTEESRSLSTFTNINDNIDNPAILEQPLGYPRLTRGLTSQPMGADDAFFDPEIRHFLFRSNTLFGTDLKALDIQRSRDHGIPSYNRLRSFCGLRIATTWNDFTDLIPLNDVTRLSKMYLSVEDVDLSVGMQLETRIAGTQVGPTAHCIIMEQFRRARVGDRFFFETSDVNTRYTPAQLVQIRKASIGRILCDNSPGVAQMQGAAFRQISLSNPLVACSSLPVVDTLAWKV